MDTVSLLKKPSALLPLVMSLVALAMVIVYAAIFGITPHADEGTPARIFQFLLVAQLPIVTYFILRWLPKYLKESLRVLALHASAWLAAFATIYILEHWCI